MGKTVKYLLINIDTKTFNRIIRFVTKSIGATSDLYFMCDESIAKKLLQKLKDENEFIRLKQEEHYMDLAPGKFTVIGTYVTISFGHLIDHNRTRFIPKLKNK